MNITIFATKAFLIFLLLGIYHKKTNAEIFFNGDWANYIGHYYDKNGWKNGKPNGKPTGHDGWNDFYAFWSPPLPNTWLFNTSTAPDRIQLVKDVTSPKKGVVARFEVRSGDHRPIHSGERSEMYTMLGKDRKSLPVSESNGHEYYGISIKLSEDWKEPQAEPANKGFTKWGSFMQLHSPNAYNSPPAILLAVDNQFGVEMNAGELMTLVDDKKTGQVIKKKKKNTYFELTNGDLRKGKWVQFILDVVWKKDDSGSVKLFRRDEGEKSFVNVLALSNIPTLQTSKHIPTDLARCPTCAKKNLEHYWRVGYYRSTSPNQTNVLWLGPVVRGNDFDEVAVTAFGKTGPILGKN